MRTNSTDCISVSLRPSHSKPLKVSHGSKRNASKRNPDSDYLFHCGKLTVNLGQCLNPSYHWLSRNPVLNSCSSYKTNRHPLSQLQFWKMIYFSRSLVSNICYAARKINVVLFCWAGLLISFSSQQCSWSATIDVLYILSFTTDANGRLVRTIYSF